MSPTTLLLAAEAHSDSIPPIAVGIIVLAILMGLLAVTLFVGGGRPHD